MLIFLLIISFSYKINLLFFYDYFQLVYEIYDYLIKINIMMIQMVFLLLKMIEVRLCFLFMIIVWRKMKDLLDFGLVVVGIEVGGDCWKLMLGLDGLLGFIYYAYIYGFMREYFM